MDINAVIAILGPLTEAQAATYEARLPYAVAYINEDCGGRFTTQTEDGETITLPEGVKIGAALLVKCMVDNPGAASKTLADMSISYEDGGPKAAARSYWKSYRKAKFF